MTGNWSEEEIAAFVDGALESEDTARIADIIAHDAKARAFAESISRSNSLLRAAYAEVASSPVPSALSDVLSTPPSNVVAFARPSRLRTTWIPAAAAASVAVVIGLAAGAMLQAPSGPTQVTLGDTPPGSMLAVALETTPSGTKPAGRVVPMLTFKDAQGRYCREFEVNGDLPSELEFGIACRTEEEAWHVEIIVTAPQAKRGEDGFVPASGPGADALEAMLDALGAGLPLSPNNELQAIQGGWTSE